MADTQASHTTDPDNGALLGRLAVHYKLITMDQLTEVTREQGRRGPQVRLGDLLVEMGYLDPGQLERIVVVQKDLLARRAGGATRPGGTGTATPGHGAAQPGGASSGHEATQPGAAASAAPEPAGVASGRAPSAAQERATPDRPAATQETRPTPHPAMGAARAAAPPQRGPAVVAAASRPQGAIDGLLREAVAAGASDVHVHAGAPVRVRRHGRLKDRPGPPLDAAAAEALALELLGPAERALLDQHGEVDFCYTLPGVGRFRSNVYRQLRGLDAVLRVVPPKPPTLDELGLPQELAKFTNFHQGMVLVTGPAGCGKSSTLAALVNLINQERRDHILTVEDPIEFLHPSKRCLVNQRNVGRHTGSFARALRAALREDPDVIVIGELRDLETISLALTAAETGHLVLATLHTNDTIRTVNRLVGAFPADQQDQVRTMVSESLRAVVSQRLVAAADGERRLPALEVLVVNKAIGNLVRENKTFQLRSILQTGSAQGMYLLDQSLARMVEQGLVSREEARRHCEDPKRLAGG